MNINFNGKILPSDQPIFKADNRAFLYGDALFETIRMFDGKLPFLNLHLERLLAGLHFFKYKVPKKFNSKFFKKEIKKIAYGNARIRITVFRSEGGLYTPKNNRPQFLITTSPLPSAQFKFNKKGLNIGIFENSKLKCAPISNLKTCNSLPYIQAALYKKEQNLDDCILLNEKGKIAEANSSNIFLLQKNKLVTPSLSEGCINGNMRKLILLIAKEEKIEIKERFLNLSELKKANEILLTNSIQGIRWVKKIKPNITLAPPVIIHRLITKLNLLINNQPYP